MYSIEVTWEPSCIILIRFQMLISLPRNCLQLGRQWAPLCGENTWGLLLLSTALCSSNRVILNKLLGSVFSIQSGASPQLISALGGRSLLKLCSLSFWVEHFAAWDVVLQRYWFSLDIVMELQSFWLNSAAVIPMFLFPVKKQTNQKTCSKMRSVISSGHLSGVLWNIESQKWM